MQNKIPVVTAGQTFFVCGMPTGFPFLKRGRGGATHNAAKLLQIIEATHISSDFSLVYLF